VVILAPLLQRALAQGGQAQQVLRITLIHRTSACADKRRHPTPLLGIEAWAQFQRRVTAHQPAKRLQRHSGISQRRDIAVGQLPAVGETGFAAQSVASVDHRHFMAGTHQRIRTRQANDSTANDANLPGHPRPLAID